MNAVEIEEAITDLAEQPFDCTEFPYAFLEAFDNRETTLKRLRSGETNKSDVGGVLQTNNIHILVCNEGQVTQALEALRASPATTKAKAKFILATDGVDLEAEELSSGETVACAYADLPNHFGFFLPLAGINTISQIKENSFDIRATSRLNKLYVELLKVNPAWAKAERRHDMNQFMARLIFCFFAEDTEIFGGKGKFTDTVARMSAGDEANTHKVIATLFRAMNTKREDRQTAGLPKWANADDFPYVNGQLFSGSEEVPIFNKIARSYLLHVGGLDWTKINPDIFGSMIQAISDDEERGELGMHYTSVPNIMKVLTPLFLGDLKNKLAEAENNDRALRNLRKRIANIRVFDPACGSGNFLVIAYKEMRAIEAEINARQGNPDRASDIALTNFRGIELRDFPAEVARLALVIAQYQCDVLYRGQRLALGDFLPLRCENWITCGNAIRMDWSRLINVNKSRVTSETQDVDGKKDGIESDEYKDAPIEVYICGNPPYAGLSSQSQQQKSDLAFLFDGVTPYWKSYDYVMAWFWKARSFMINQKSKTAFVSTNSICQGQLVPMFWPMIIDSNIKIFFAYTSFRWRNLAAHNAGVTVQIIGLTSDSSDKVRIFESTDGIGVTEKQVECISPYIVSGYPIYVDAAAKAMDDRPEMFWGNKPVDDGNLVFASGEADEIVRRWPDSKKFLKPYFGSSEFIKGVSRVCIWVSDSERDKAAAIPDFARRFERVRHFRASSKAKETRSSSSYSHRFRQIQGFPGRASIIVPIHSSELRQYLPVGLLSPGSIISNAAYALYDAPLWSMALIASRLHLIWIATVCGKLETRYRYSNTLGWNTFPVPVLTEKNKTDLSHCAEDILLAREAHFPATIADLYDPSSMPPDLHAAHDRNDEVLERIYIGRRFKNDTERLEKLFELYSKMIASTEPVKRGKRKKGVVA